MSERELELSQKQIEFLDLPDREALLEAGIGFGKTFILAMWLYFMQDKYPKTKWFFAARDAKQLRDATDVEIQTVLEILGLKQGVHYERKQSPKIEYTFKRSGSTIIGLSAHNYDSAFRGSNYSGGFGDEVDYWKREAYFAAKGRVRKHPELIRWGSSPDGFNHVYEDFHVNKIGPIVHATSYDNPDLSKEYIESLRKSYSPKLFEQEVMAKRLNLKQGAVYSEFNRERHVHECKAIYEPKLDKLYFFVDYNIANYCGVYIVKKNDKVFVIGEEHLKFQGTEHMAQVVRSKYPEALVAGDSAGNNKRDTAATNTNYQIFQKYGLTTLNYKNPLVEKRVISTQSHFYHDRIIIDPSCKTLIKDLELLCWKEDGSGIEKTVDLSHASDALGYGAYHLLDMAQQIKPLQPLNRY